MLSENDHYYSQLADKWLKGKADPAEESDLFNWMENRLGDEVHVPESFAACDDALKKRMLSAIMDQQNAVPMKTGRTLKWFHYAAAILLILLSADYFFKHDRVRQHEPTVVKQPTPTDILPGNDKAILTLASGKKIALGEVSGTINEGTTVIKNANGKLIYTHSTVVEYNTMSTPRGGQYQLVLSDGSRVWLNAESSISFPTAFPGKQRTVTVTGEAYFEVASDKNKPFIVNSGKEKIEVVGTHFNLNAYENEDGISTTLLEGQVRIDNILLKPGQTCSNGKVSTADIDHIMAWKNGFSSFKSANIQTIMRQVERWYDVDVELQHIDLRRTFTGEIPRNIGLSEFLKVLSVIGIHYSIDAQKKKISIHS